MLHLTLFCSTLRLKNITFFIQLDTGGDYISPEYVINRKTPTFYGSVNKRETTIIMMVIFRSGEKCRIIRVFQLQ